MATSLIYYNLAGKAEVLRMIFKHAKVDFEDKRFSEEEIIKMKAEGQFPNG